jgi:putative membrane protein
VALLEHIGDQLRRAWQAGWIDTLHLPALDASLSGLTDHQGGCERIRSTPIPFSYTILIHRIVAVYCLTLPFGIVEAVGAYTPLVAAMVAYAFFGLDAIGDAIEEPFGTDLHDLPLDTLSTMIEINVREAIGDADLPPPRVPVGEWLS